MHLARTIAVVGGLAVLAVGAVFPLLSRRQTPAAAQSEAGGRPVVQVARAESRRVGRTVRLAGTLRSGSEAELAPKQGGKIAAVLVREGQSVRRGQELVRMDASDSRGAAEQAAAGVEAARAAWQKATRAVDLKRVDVDRRISEARRGVSQARLQLDKAEAGIRVRGRTDRADVERAQAGADAARSELAKAQQGARPEQRRQAEIRVQQAERGVRLAKKNLDDIEFLYSKGGVPRLQLDEAREGHQKALDGLGQAKADLSLLQAGASPEEIAAAEAGVRNAEAALAAAKAGADRGDLDRADVEAARGQLGIAEDGLKAAVAARGEIELVQRDAAAARAGHEQALAGSRLAAQQVSETSITSPVDGVVTSLAASVGEIAGPGRPLVTVVGTAGVYLEAAVPAREVRALQIGQRARVTLDALPGREFAGVVRSVAAAAGSDGRSFPARIDLSAPPGLLQPGAFARAEVEAGAAVAVTVPAPALRSSGAGTAVWVVRDGRIAEVPVATPRQDRNGAVVTGDVHPGDRVVVSNPPEVEPGVEVETR